MTAAQLIEAMAASPVIPAVKDEAGLTALQETEGRIVFVLYGNLLCIGEIVERIRAMGKHAIVHVDLIEGLASREIAADFIARNTRAQGVISTRPAVIRRAKELGLLTVQRFFLLDSLAFENLRAQAAQTRPDVIEVLPGGLSKVIRVIRREFGPHLIAGGLMMDKDDVIAALSAGAAAVSTTNTALWRL